MSAAQEGHVVNSPRRGRPVSTHTQTIHGEDVSNEQVKEWLMELISGEEHCYGYELLTECLRIQYHLKINKKKTYRLCEELDILQPQRRKKTHYPRRLAKNHTITGANQLWQFDIKYGYVDGYKQFFFMANLVDVFDRNLVGQHVGSSCQATDVCAVVKNALQNRIASDQDRPIIRTDNGPQFVSKAFGEFCEAENIVHERIPPKTPNMNAYVESFHATLERDLLSKESFQTFNEAFTAVREYAEFYNNRRMHRSLGKKSPAAFLEWSRTAGDESMKKYSRAL
jgi:putative transposase